MVYGAYNVVRVNT